MKFIAFTSDKGPRLGLVDGAGDRLADITERAGTADLVGVIERWEELRAKVAGAEPTIAVASVKALAPIPRPRRNVFCVGKNYREHAAEFGKSGYDAGSDTKAADHVPTKPVVFTKAPQSVVATNTTIDPHSDITKELDYEAELAVIIGKGGKRISKENALEHVWGYTIVNDVTARDLQRDHKQWFLGKSIDGFCPMGPWAVTADEVDGANLDVECRVNGEVRQKASTKDLIFDIPTLIATISAGIALEPGDIIATGTPAGVGIGFDPPRFLKTGDVVEVAIGGLGRLVTTIG